MADDGSRDPEISLESFLKFAIKNSDRSQISAEGSEEPAVDVEGEQTASGGPLDLERRQWLKEALSHHIRTESEIVSENLDVLRQPQITDEDRRTVLENLHDLCENMDNARDFCKLEGLSVVDPFFDRNTDPGVCWRSCDLIAALCQNNPFCQDQVLNHGLLARLLLLLDTGSDNIIRIKALYALSCFVRGSLTVLQAFVQANGFSALMRAMQSNVDKLRIKASFMLSGLCQENSKIKGTLHMMGMVDQLVALLQTEHEPSHEHIASALVSLISGHRSCIESCRRSELHLADFFRERMALIHGREEFEEELNHYTELERIVFRSSGVPDDDEDEPASDRMNGPVAKNIVFVTVGSTSFDLLTETVCSDLVLKILKSQGFDTVLLQIGRGQFEPPAYLMQSVDPDVPYVEFYRYKSSIAEDIRTASLVISHAGAGSIVECLEAGRKLIVVINEQLMDNHQIDIARKMYELGYIYYCTCLSLDATLVHKDRSILKPYTAGKPSRFTMFLNRVMGHL